MIYNKNQSKALNNRVLTPVFWAVGLALLTACGDSNLTLPTPPAVPEVTDTTDNSDSTEDETTEESLVEDAKVLIEHNAADEDTGFQGFADGEPWNALTITGPDDVAIISIDTAGGFLDFGVTELFFETNEPENAEVPISDVLQRLPQGEYQASAVIIDEEEAVRSAEFTHTIPVGAEITSPQEDAKGLDASNLLIAWEPSTSDLDGNLINIVGYQIIVEKADYTPEFPSGFAEPVLSVYMPADARMLIAPEEFMETDECYEMEILSIEESGNQTITAVEFETGEGCDREEAAEDETPQMRDAKILIEHNATDEDTGFQGFADGDPWNSLVIDGPDGQSILNATAEGGLFNFGLTELFFETSEPENSEVAISEVLARMPEGIYSFTADVIDTGMSTITAEFSHAIPQGPEITTPEQEQVVPIGTLVISWEPVAQDLNGNSVTIVGYQVIVEADEDPEYPQGFYTPFFSVYLPASATTVTLPDGFLQLETSYKTEVFAIEASGNQTLTAVEFETQ
ncbi:MAG: hypothetical protein ACFHVJ_09815 [Aestuariibacter sp.]